MYKHFLIAVDGSELSDRSLGHGVRLAKALGAQVTVLHVTPPWSSIAAGEIAVMFPPDEYEAGMVRAASQLLARMSTAAEAEGVKVATLNVSDPNPDMAIIAAA